MELESSLQNSKQPVTCPYLEPDKSNTHPIILFIKNNFIIIFHLHSDRPLYLFTSSEHSMYVSNPLKPPDHPNSIW